ncbi:MAG: hypothetical protein MZV65_18980 [Chromatiales bacterium]|nr:hypothetical protein [Chromatiales bacterium]
MLRAASDWDGLIPELARDYRVFDIRSTRLRPLQPAQRALHAGDCAAFVRQRHRARVRRPAGAHRRPLARRCDRAALCRALPRAGHGAGAGGRAGPSAPHGLRRVSQPISASTPCRAMYPDQNDHLRNLASIIGLVERMQPTPEAIVGQSEVPQSFLNEDPAKIAGLALALEDFGADLPRVTMPTLLRGAGATTSRRCATARPWRPCCRTRRSRCSASGHTPMDDAGDVQCAGARVPRRPAVAGSWTRRRCRWPPAPATAAVAAGAAWCSRATTTRW